MKAPISRKRTRLRLRGDRLTAAALRELADIECWAREPGLTWVELASRMGVTRQAVATKPEIVEAYHKTKTALNEARPMSPEAIVKRSMMERLESMKVEMAEMQIKLDRWIEKWVAVEAYCHANGSNGDAILDPFKSRETAVNPISEATAL